MKNTRIVQLKSGGGYAEVVGEGGVKMGDETVQLVSLRFQNGEVRHYPADQIDGEVMYSASVEVDDPGSADNVEDAAAALVAWIKNDEGPVYVDVVAGTFKYEVSVMAGDDGRMVGTISGRHH